MKFPAMGFFSSQKTSRSDAATPKKNSGRVAAGVILAVAALCIVHDRSAERAKEEAKTRAKEFAEDIANREVEIGMSAAQCEAAWGKPLSINRTDRAEGTREQWVYSMTRYLYLENGVLVSIQTSK